MLDNLWNMMTSEGDLSIIGFILLSMFLIINGIYGLIKKEFDTIPTLQRMFFFPFTLGTILLEYFIKEYKKNKDYQEKTKELNTGFPAFVSSISCLALGIFLLIPTIIIILKDSKIINIDSDTGTMIIMLSMLSVIIFMILFIIISNIIRKKKKLFVKVPEDK